jgi:hypothetical protein
MRGVAGSRSLPEARVDRLVQQSELRQPPDQIAPEDATHRPAPPRAQQAAPTLTLGEWVEEYLRRNRDDPAYSEVVSSRPRYL